MRKLSTAGEPSYIIIHPLLHTRTHAHKTHTHQGRCWIGAYRWRCCFREALSRRQTAARWRHGTATEAVWLQLPVSLFQGRCGGGCVWGVIILSPSKYLVVQVQLLTWFLRGILQSTCPFWNLNWGKNSVDWRLVASLSLSKAKSAKCLETNKMSRMTSCLETVNFLSLEHEHSFLLGSDSVVLLLLLKLRYHWSFGTN